MKIFLKMILMGLLLLLFSGCCSKEIVYVKTPCPKLQNFYSDFNSSFDDNLTVDVELLNAE
jgi:hypothetical protein